MDKFHTHLTQKDCKNRLTEMISAKKVTQGKNVFWTKNAEEVNKLVFGKRKRKMTHTCNEIKVKVLHFLEKEITLICVKERKICLWASCVLFVSNSAKLQKKIKLAKLRERTKASVNGSHVPIVNRSKAQKNLGFCFLFPPKKKEWIPALGESLSLFHSLYPETKEK